MPTCESTTFADVALMVIQFGAIGFSTLVAMGFLQRGIKVLSDAAWNRFCRLLRKEGTE